MVAVVAVAVGLLLGRGLVILATGLVVTAAVGLGLPATVVALGVLGGVTVGLVAAAVGLGLPTAVVLGGPALGRGALGGLHGEGVVGNRGHGLAGGRLAVVGAGENQQVLPVGRVGGRGQVALEVAVGVDRQLPEGVVDAGVVLVLDENGDFLAGVEALSVEGEGLTLTLRAGGDLVGAADARVVEVDLSLLLSRHLGHLGLAAVSHASGADGPAVGGGGGGGADGLDERCQVEVGGPAAVRGGLGLDDVGGGAVRGVQRNADGGLLPRAPGSGDREGRVRAGGDEGLLLSDLEAAARGGLAGAARGGLGGAARARGARAAGAARAVPVGVVGEGRGSDERGSGHCSYCARCCQGTSKTHVSS